MAIARLMRVDRSYREWACQTCGKTIQKGDPYVWFKFRFGDRNVRCLEHIPEAWERESNPKRRALMRAGDAIDDARSESDPLSAIAHLENAIGFAQEARDAFQEAIDAWQGTNLESSEKYATFDYAIQDLDQFLSDVETAIDELNQYATDQDNADPDDENDDQVWSAWSDTIELPDVPDVDF